MDSRPSKDSQPPAPRGGHDLDPRITLGAALIIGALGAYFVDWRMGFLVFISVVSLFTPHRPRGG